MKISGNAIRPGNVINHEGKLWIAVKTQHTQPGKGGAYLQVELKAIIDGTKKNERFRSSENVERVYLEERPYQFLFDSGDDLTFMDTETFEQITLSKEFVGDSASFLTDGMIIGLSMYENDPITINLPETVVLEIVEAEPVVKGQTASSSYKPAILSNGLRIMVPPYIESGTKVIIRTEDSSFVERYKDA
jgi:elongation factor P